MINFFDVVSEYISFIETNIYSSCEALSDQEMKAYGLIISGVNADLLTKQQNFELRVRLYDVVEAQKELFIQFQDEDILDQIFGTEPETHISVTCPDCGSLVSYFSDLEFHNCSGEF